MIITTDEKLIELQEKLKKADEEAMAAYRNKSNIEEQIRERRLQIFKDSKILNKIGWVVKINETKGVLFLVPDEKKERDWVDKFNQVTPEDCYHYKIDMGNCFIVVNDYDIEITFGDKYDALTAINELGLKIIRNEVSEKKKLLEDKIQKLSEIEKHLEAVKK